METREMLAFGRFRREERMALSVAAEQAAFTLHAAESPEEAGRWLESHEAMALLLDTEASESLAVRRAAARITRAYPSSRCPLKSAICTSTMPSVGAQTTYCR